MSPEVLEPLERKSTPGIIADKLRQAIRYGELVAGQQLGEADLARRLGVSRGPLREGMQRLTQEGLLHAIPNRGVFVVELTAEDIRDIYLARTAIERAAAAAICRHDPQRASEELLAVNEQMAEGADAHDPAAVGQADIAFHDRLVSLADSFRLSRMHQTLLTETTMCINALGGSYPVPDQRVPEHRKIAEAFGADNPDRAGTVDTLLVAHMEDAVQRLTDLFP